MIQIVAIQSQGFNLLLALNTGVIASYPKKCKLKLIYTHQNRIHAFSFPLPTSFSRL